MILPGRVLACPAPPSCNSVYPGTGPVFCESQLAECTPTHPAGGQTCETLSAPTLSTDWLTASGSGLSLKLDVNKNKSFNFNALFRQMTSKTSILSLISFLSLTSLDNIPMIPWQ